MGSAVSSHHVVQKIETRIANYFLRKHEQCVSSHESSLSSYGLFNGAHMIGLAQFCAPETREIQKKYTYEIFNIFLDCTEEEQIRSFVNELISFFINDKKPFSLIAYKNFNLSKECYINSGMTLGSNQNLKNIDSKSMGKEFYEWINPDVNFYTYKITSIKDDSYYFGRRTVRHSKSTEEDCLNDGYMGSGGLKFQNWVSQVGEESLQKTIINIHTTWESVVSEENWLIGESYLSDPRCMNSISGGINHLGEYSYFTFLECEIHGVAAHRKNECHICNSKKIFSKKFCDTHNEETTHRGGSCAKCQADRTKNHQQCPEHGWVIHWGDNCSTCMAGQIVKTQTCEIHGKVAFVGAQCRVCVNQKTVSQKKCVIHGAVTHQGTTCLTCAANKRFVVKECQTHGLTKHNMDTCVKCTVNGSISEKMCEIHGITKFFQTTCSKCFNQKQFTEQECGVHGKVKFKGSSCCKCTSEKTAHARFHKGSPKSNCSICTNG